MRVDELDRIARELRAGKEAPGVEVIKASRVRIVARVGEALLKVFLEPRGRPEREARALREAARRGVRVPETIGNGPEWIATRWVEGRSATRDDLPAILEVAERMHRGGMLHGDFHLGNLIVDDSGVVVTDLHGARFLPWLPGPLRRRELGWLAYSLGEPVPRELESVRFWRDLRAQTHWRSRTRRCVMESGSFTRFRTADLAGFRRRDTDPEELAGALRSRDRAELLKDRPGARLLRHGRWILKEHPTSRAARRSWLNGQGLEARGIRTGRPLAWAGRWLVMEDAGPTVADWVEHRFESTSGDERDAFAGALAGLLSDLHRRGIYHADLKANNIVWAPGASPGLLDYVRVQFGWSVSLRRRIKNLAQLNAALPDTVPASLRERALQHYLEQSSFEGDAERLRGRVIELSLRRNHRWHGC
jgi:tRNA A-37 threonylcarbamoyl transferase component Bud32